MTLRTRKPSGRIPWPLILIEGAEKAGKSWAAAELSASPKVGQTYWIDLGEGSADEYGAVPGARYLIVEHDGSFAQLLTAVEDIKAEAAKASAANLPPVVLVLDSATAEWDLLKGNADAKARDRMARKGRKLDPDAEPQISMDLWNEANSKHRRLMTHLMTFPGIVVVTARGKEVAALDAGGRPVEGSKEYKVEGQKNLAFDASVWIRVSRDNPPLVVGARSVHAGVRPGVDKPRPAPGLTLERVVFDILKCVPGEVEVREVIQPRTTAADLAEVEPETPVAGPDPTAELTAQIAAASNREDLATAWKDLVAAGLREQLEDAWKARRDALRSARPAAPPMPTEKDKRRLFALLKQADITDRDDRLKWYSEVCERSIESTSELSSRELELVCGRTQAYIEQQNAPVGASA